MKKNKKTGSSNFLGIPGFKWRLSIYDQVEIYKRYKKKGDVAMISRMTGYEPHVVSQVLRGHLTIGCIMIKAHEIACLRIEAKRLKIGDDLNKKRAFINSHRERGDITLISRLTGFAVSTVSDVLRGVYDNEKIINAAYKMIIDNDLGSSETVKRYVYDPMTGRRHLYIHGIKNYSSI